MNRRNMLKLADFAEAKFGDAMIDMTHWRTCLVGQAAQCNVFRGLKYADDDIDYGGKYGWEALCKLLGVGILDAVLMFDGYVKKSGHTIAADIRLLVKSTQEQAA